MELRIPVDLVAEVGHILAVDILRYLLLNDGSSTHGLLSGGIIQEFNQKKLKLCHYTHRRSAGPAQVNWLLLGTLS